MKTRRKKHLMAFVAALLMLAACTDDSPAPATDVYDGKKLARWYTVMYDTPEGDYQPILRDTYEFGWEGDRLAYLSYMDDGVYRFVYDGDLLVGFVFGDDLNLNYKKTEISYSNGRMATKKVYRDNHLNYTQDFIYGSDGLLQKIITVGDVFSGKETRTYSLSWQDGNVVSIEHFINGVSTSFITFEYDDAPNPMRPAALVFLNAYGDCIELLSKNNVVLEKSWGEGWSDENRLEWTYDDGYPAKGIRYYEDAPENVHLDTYYEYADGTGARPE